MADRGVRLAALLQEQIDARRPAEIDRNMMCTLPAILGGRAAEPSKGRIIDLHQESSTQQVAIEAPRLGQVLASKVGTIFGESVIAVDEHGAGVDVTFVHNRPERFDIVIGAGGLHSPIGALVFGPENRFEKYLGYCAAAFTIAGHPHRDAHGYVGHAAPGRQVMRCAMRGNRTVVFLVFSSVTVPSRALHETEVQQTMLRDTFGRDSWEVPDLLAGLDRCSDLYFDAVSQIRMDGWSRGRVALVGMPVSARHCWQGKARP
jgi:2-polyprenyl-6-methoxyphenol hydroxylase-like FAD-dependent oxidoreductase